MPLISFGGQFPFLGEGVFVAPTAHIIGAATLGDDVSVWFGAVIRADLVPITIGSGTSVQEHVMIHCDLDYPTTVGRNVTIGHNAVLHGCTVEDNCVIGMHSVVMNGAVIRKGSVVAGGAVIPEGKEYPPNSLIVGSPGKVLREVTPEMGERFVLNATHYVELAHRYLAMGIGVPEIDPTA